MKRANEVLVGAAVVGAIVLMALGSIWLSQQTFGGRETLAEARYRTIGGLQKGNAVWIRGVRIGHVEAITLGDSNWVNVTFRIGSDAQLPQDPVAIIVSTTLFGDWGVNIVAPDGVPDDPEVQRQVTESRAAGRDRWPGATLPAIGELTAAAGRIAGDIANIAGRVEAAFDSGSSRRLQGAFVDLSNLSRRLSNIVLSQARTLDTVGQFLTEGTASLSRGAASLERTLQRADSATNNQQLQRILGRTDSVADNLQDIAENLRTVSQTAARNQAAIGRIIQNTDSILGRIQSGQGTLGRLVADTSLYGEALESVKDLRRLLVDVRNNPRKYFSFSVF